MKPFDVWEQVEPWSLTGQNKNVWEQGHAALGFWGLQVPYLPLPCGEQGALPPGGQHSTGNVGEVGLSEVSCGCATVS